MMLSFPILASDVKWLEKKFIKKIASLLSFETQGWRNLELQ